MATLQHIPFTFEALRDTGVLWLVNRAVFHPRGVALALHLGTTGGVIGWSLVASPDGSPFTFDGTTIDEAARMQAVEELIRVTKAGEA
ncbi:hypothetical protein [Kribbella sp. NPDC051718]|uniref:hypothetical protein n=1 Tax=Kribbella sp. NPDC051718 TaxID=3155168 RepID=UPI00343EA741